MVFTPAHGSQSRHGSWCPYGDYHRLNNITTPDRYPVPHIQDFSAHLAGTCIYSKVDLVQGYHQIPVHHDDITQNGRHHSMFSLYEFLQMPFGLKNACTRFSATDGHGLSRPSWHFCVFGQHPDHQQQPQAAFAAHPSAVQPPQAIWSGGKTGQVHFFGVLEVDFLGHHINCQGTIPLPEKVAKVHDFA